MLTTRASLPIPLPRKQMYILMRLLGGAKKRKKKTYTKPKKQKHK